MAQALSQLNEIPSDVYVECLDSQENVRLRKARKRFLPLKREEIGVLSAVYEIWELTHEALILKGTNLKSGEISFVGVKASKRGNDVCSKRQNEKIQFLRTLRKDAHFFSMEDALAGKALANVLWVTLTFDSKLCSLHEAWINLSPRISRFLDGLKRRYGDVQHWLTPEVFPEEFQEDGETPAKGFGYPHVHMILMFKDQKFRVFPWMEKDEEGRETLSYRIQERDQLREAGDWHSFIQVNALRNASGVVGYCRKHMENTIQGESSQAFLNNSIMWLYRKKSYSMSQDFRACFVEFITTMQVSGACFQLDLFGERVQEWSWEFLGVGSMERLGMKPWIWSQPLDPGVVQDELRRKRGRLLSDDY
jgi:hypothetical protein